MVDLQDAVLFHHAEEHEDAEHGEDVHRLLEEDEREDGKGQRERQGEQNGERMHPALKLRGEDEIHEDEGHQKRDHEGLSRLGHFLRASGAATGVVGRQVEHLHGGGDAIKDFGFTHSRGVVGGDGDLAAAVETVDLRGAVRVFQREQIGDGDGSGLGGGHGEEIEDFAGVAVALLSLEMDVVLLAAVVEGGDVETADEQAQRAGDVLDAGSHLACFVAVHAAGDFRLAGNESAVEVADAGEVFDVFDH